MISNKIQIVPLTDEKFAEAVQLLLKANLDTQSEIEHHLQHLEAHYLAMFNKNVVGVIGWYQDNVDYATKAMGSKFPGIEAYWVGFFAVAKGLQKKGIGSKLITKLEQVLIQKGVNQLWVSSVPESASYYQKQGFKYFMKGKIGDSLKIFMVKKLI